MLPLTILRNVLLAAVLLAFGTTAACATTVLSATDKLVGPVDASKLSFTLPDAGPGYYDIAVTLTDLSSGLFTPFTTLGTEVVNSTTVFGSKDSPGTFSIPHLNSGNYDVWTLGATSLIGIYGIKVDASFSPVPLPASVVLLGTALTGLLALTRRRKPSMVA